MSISITVANEQHHPHAIPICQMIENAAKVRGTGIAKRDPAYIRHKMSEGKAVIAFDEEHVIGFCYIESWEGQKYVANSGLIVHPDYRKTGLARAIKSAIFDLSKKTFPEAKLFGITTSMAVMKINSELGYKPVTFSALTQDEAFWQGCQSCPNYDILQRTQKTMCLCTGMVCDLTTVSDHQAAESKNKAWHTFLDFMKQRRTRLQQKAKQFPKLSQAINDEKE